MYFGFHFVSINHYGQKKIQLITHDLTDYGDEIKTQSQEHIFVSIGLLKNKCPFFLDIFGHLFFSAKKNMVTKYFICFSSAEHKNFYAVVGSPKNTSTLFTNKVLRILKLDIYKCPKMKS